MTKRKFKLTKAQQDEFIEHIRAGMRRGAVAEAMELKRIDVIAYIRDTPVFEALVVDAEEMATEQVEEALWHAAVSGSVPAAKMWLDMKKPKQHTTPNPSGPDLEPEVVEGADADLEAIWRMTTE